MRTRINYTGRRRIRREDARFIVSTHEDRPPTFRARLNLKPYRLTTGASVSLEAYRQTTWMRFSAGTVGVLAVDGEFELTQFPTADGVRFRVRVTSPDSEKKLLAAADKIAGQSSDDDTADREPLLPVKPDDLNGEVWRVEIKDPHPLLLIDARCRDWRGITREPYFISLVYPAALRQVLSAIAAEGDTWWEVDSETWQGKWVAFAKAIPGVPEPSVHVVPEEWIDEVVEAFSRQLKMLDRFLGYLGQGETA